MGDKATIEAVLKNKTLEDLETPIEKSARERPSSVVVTLTPPIINQVVDKLVAGESLREIKATPVQIGPAGQKWKLTNAQVRAIDQARKERIAELTTDVEE